METNQIDIMDKVVLRMLSVALMEIRATTDLRAAQALADIFHSAPYEIVNNKSFEEIYERILESSERQNMRKYTEKLRMNSEEWVRRKYPS